MFLFLFLNIVFQRVQPLPQIFNLCFSICDINLRHLRIQYSVPISIQDCVDYSLPLLTLCFLPQNTSISSFPLLFPIQFCESLWLSGLRRTLWEQITAQICLSSLESPFLSSCSPLSPSSLSYSSCNSEPLWLSLTVENLFTINLEVLLSVL